MEVFCTMCGEKLTLDGIRSREIPPSKTAGKETHIITCGNCLQIWKFKLDDLGPIDGDIVSEVKIQGKLNQGR